MPKVQNFTIRVISSNQQADELAADGIEFRSNIRHARLSLDKGAIAFCFFVDGELAHIGWVALSKEAKNTFDHTPTGLISLIKKRALEALGQVQN